MKIIFLCGCLEPGRDGVGDYSRRLAGELIQTGHEVGIVSLNDQHITETNSTQQYSGAVPIPVLRLPDTWTTARRFQKARFWIEDFNPDWISLQFVPFAFHPKGLPFSMGKMLKTFGKERNWHIMVHELWVGMDKESPRKFVYWGWLQKQLIKSIFKKLHPRIIHTQSSLYMKMLAKIGLKAIHLPLFGNIQVEAFTRKPEEQLAETQRSPGIITWVVFGGVHPGAPIGALAKELKLYSNAKGIKVSLKMVGRNGPDQVRWEQEWKAAGLQVELIGEQPPENISEILSNSSFGISTTPASLIEKSGSVAAMQEHGLSILCISRPWHPRGIEMPDLPPGITNYKEGEIGDFMTAGFKLQPFNSIGGVCRQFVNNLLSSQQ
jgi:hypothetical protein